MINIFFEKRFWRPIVFEDCILYFIKNAISLKALEHDQLKTEKSTLKTLFSGETTLESNIGTSKTPLKLVQSKN